MQWYYYYGGGEANAIIVVHRMEWNQVSATTIVYICGVPHTLDRWMNQGPIMLYWWYGSVTAAAG